MTCAVFAFPECAEPAASLARALGVDCRAVELHQFPDGESLVRIAEGADTALLYRSLDRPNEKIFELVLAASALRDSGCRRVIMVVPYLAYMRQDRRFRPGEAISQRVLGTMLAQHCDALITVDPHLHRIGSLSEVMPGIEAASVSAGPLLAAALLDTGADLLVGPDGEARRWVEAIAKIAGLPYLVGRKRRQSDRKVELEIPHAERAAGRQVVLIDDLVSSGATLTEAVRLLRDAGARSVTALATHCLASLADLRALREAGIASIRSTQTVPCPTGNIEIAPVLAQEIRRRRWMEMP